MDFGLLGELALTGALVGAMYGLVALGIVLIYKTSGTANFAQGAIAMMGGYITWLFAAGVGLPTWLALAAAVIVMFFFGVLVERTVLRRMVGQPVIMVVMLSFGIELLLRGAVPGLLGSAVKRLSLGIPQAPVFLGDMLINRAYLIGGGISAAKDPNSSGGSCQTSTSIPLGCDSATRSRPGFGGVVFVRAKRRYFGAVVVVRNRDAPRLVS